jgi:hypothetical protein
MTLSHGQQVELEFSDKASRKMDKRKRPWAKGKPESKAARRSQRAESTGSKTAQKAAKQEVEKKEARITFPLRLSTSEHAEWRDFAKKNRFPLHQFVKNSVDDVISRIRKRKSIPWLKIG